MGLSVCYEFRFRGDAAAARDLLQQLRNFAVQLPVESVSEITEWREGESVDDDDVEAVRWLQLFGTQYGQKRLRDGNDVWIDIPPRHVLVFAIHPAAGAETAQIGLAAHPACVEYHDHGETLLIETDLAGQYSWAQCCKTQYAGLLQNGGVENFLRAHLSLVDLLDQAAALGLDVRVADDSGFWDDRDRDKLRQQLGSWNGLVAALAGQLKDELGTELDTGVQAPILSAPNFEHLEAAGLKEWSEPPLTEDA